MKPNIGRRWFVEMNGRAQGPYDQAQVQDLARLKKINPMTKIFAEGDVRWRLMNEYEQFKLAPEPVSEFVAREWVILKRKTLKEAELSQNKFDQLGPFTVDEIVQQIKTGDLSYNDYVWKKGFQRWAKLESLPEFNHTIKPSSTRIPEPPRPAGVAFASEPKLDLNQHEQEELDHFTATNTEKIEANKPKGNSKKSVRAVEEGILEKPKITDSDIVLKPQLSLGRKVYRVAMSTVAAVLITSVAYNFVKGRSTQPIAAQQAPPAAPVAAPQAAVPAIVEVVPPPLDSAPVIEAQPSFPAQQAQFQARPAAGRPNQLPQKQYAKADYEMPKTPRLDLEILRPESVGQVVFATNAPVNFPVEVKVTGKSGQILKYASYSQTFKIQRQGGEVPSVQLSALKVPYGTYTVQAKFNDLTKQKTFFYGVRDAKFQKALEAHLKKISTEQIAEKKMVFYFLRDLETVTKNLDAERAKAGQDHSKWAKAYSSWRKDVLKHGAKAFSSLRSLNHHEIAYPEMITKAKELAQALLRQGEEMNAAVVQNRYLSSAGVGPILNQIRDFKKEVANLSRY